MLVTDGNLRASLATVRSLGRAGYVVYVCDSRGRSLAGASRYARAQTPVPDPLSKPSEFEHAVRELAKRWSIGVLLPMSDAALLALLPVADQLTGVCIPFPSYETFKRAADKTEITRVAATLGIAVPEQVVFDSREKADASMVEHLSFPLVLKPARSVSGIGSQRAKFLVAYAHDRAEFDRVVAGLPPAAFPLLVQRRIQGPGTGVFLLRWQGNLIAQFAHRRVREKPVSGGLSVCAESVEADPGTVKQSLALLEALDWNGPAMVEYKQDQATGRRYLMEINGRFWGSLQLAIDSGVDFPALLVAAALGARLIPVTHYQVGVRTRWWWGEVDHLIARMRGKGNAFGLGGRWQALGQFLMPGPGTRNEVLRFDDPWPFVHETIDWFRRR